MTDYPTTPPPQQQSNTTLYIIIIAVVVVVLLCCCCLAAIVFAGPALLGLLGPSVGNVFSNIIENIPTPTPY